MKAIADWGRKQSVKDKPAKPSTASRKQVNVGIHNNGKPHS
jgi:hypothetical protein